MKRDISAHRSGPFKQQNKGHKTGRHRSKGQVDKDQRGKTDVKSLSKRSRRELSKLQRRHRSNQIRANKKDEVLSKKRQLGEANSPPFLVTILSLAEDFDAEAILRNLLICDEEAIVTCCNRNVTFLSVPRFKQRFSFVVPDCNDFCAVLDSLKVSDTVLFLWPTDGELSQNREDLLTCCLAQGLPTYLNLVYGLADLNGKKKEACRKLFTKSLENRSLDTKFYLADSTSDAKVVLRQIGSGAKKLLNLQRYRCHLLIESTEVETSEQADLCTWKLYGYVRGQPLNVNRLIHVPGVGDFQMKQIDLVNDPHPLNAGKKNSNLMEMDTKILEIADVTKQETLISEVSPDVMSGEQTWPTEEELKNAEDAVKSGEYKKVPKGTSAYQAMWIVEDDKDGSSEDEDSEDDDDDMEEGDSDDNDESIIADNDDKDETETIPMSESENTDRYDTAMNEEDEKRLLEQFRKERENELFPDELDTPLDMSAKVRFQKYRGLKSFRTSPWDPKENLPLDYAKIFQFENFQRTKRRVLKDESVDGALHGWYVCIHVINVPKSSVEKINNTTSPLIVYGLLPHEQKMSVMNCVLRKRETCNLSIKSKDRLIFHVGYRRFAANPIFSQHTNGDKHKYERFLPNNAAAVASFFAPIIFPPATVIIFKEDSKGRQRLVATGSVIDMRPSRIVVKRIILSGHPFKIHKKGAVVRHMFFSRDDILWFKPVELRTKHGRRGHIKEPLGTHGHMKCHFDRPINSQDTVLMDLYKRVFPKWTYDPNVKKATCCASDIVEREVAKVMDDIEDN